MPKKERFIRGQCRNLRQAEISVGALPSCKLKGVYIVHCISLVPISVIFRSPCIRSVTKFEYASYASEVLEIIKQLTHYVTTVYGYENTKGL